LRGKGRDQQFRHVQRQAQAAWGMFPSPCGEKVGINVVLAVLEWAAD